jgi:Domain of unknown function (DUF6456)
MARHKTAAQYADPRPLIERAFAEPGGNKSTQKIARTLTVNLAESPLSWLHARGHITVRQLMAGEKLRLDYEAASLGPKITMAWDNVLQSRTRRSAPDPVQPCERVIAAKRRFDNALTSLGPDLSDIAWRVICAGDAVPVVEQALGWPIRSGKLVLRIALDRLAEFYRIPG